MSNRLTFFRAAAALTIFLAIGTLATATVLVSDGRWLDGLSVAVLVAMVGVLGAAIAWDTSQLRDREGTAASNSRLFIILALASGASGTAGIASGLPVLAGANLLGAAASLIVVIRLSIGR